MWHADGDILLRCLAEADDPLCCRGSAGMAERADDREEDERHADEDVDAEAGVGVLAPGATASKAGKQEVEAAAPDGGASERVSAAREAKSRASKHMQQQQHVHGEDDAGFQEVPLEANGAGGRHSVDSSSDSDSDAGMAEMDDHSRAEVRPALPPCMLKHASC